MDIFLTAYSEYWNYLVSEVTINYDYKPWYQNYFYGLIFISLIVWALELMFPWRKNQSAIRKDFWLDGFYMFFNFFIFGFAITGFYAGMQPVFGSLGIKMDSLVLINVSELPAWAGLLIFFILNDFLQWFTHVLLHRYPVLWKFHQVHHSDLDHVGRGRARAHLHCFHLSRFHVRGRGGSDLVETIVNILNIYKLSVIL